MNWRANFLVIMINCRKRVAPDTPRSSSKRRRSNNSSCRHFTPASLELTSPTHRRRFSDRSGRRTDARRRPAAASRWAGATNRSRLCRPLARPAGLRRLSSLDSFLYSIDYSFDESESGRATVSACARPAGRANPSAAAAAEFEAVIVVVLSPAPVDDIIAVLF